MWMLFLRKFDTVGEHIDWKLTLVCAGMGRGLTGSDRRAGFVVVQSSFTDVCRRCSMLSSGGLVPPRDFLKTRRLYAVFISSVAGIREQHEAFLPEL